MSGWQNGGASLAGERRGFDMKYALIFYVSMAWPIDGSIWRGHWKVDTFNSRKRCEMVARWFTADFRRETAREPVLTGDGWRYRCERVRRGS